MDDIEHAEYMNTIKKHIDVAKAALQSIADMTAGIDKAVGMMALYRKDNLDMILTCADMHR